VVIRTPQEDTRSPTPRMDHFQRPEAQVVELVDTLS
jgi:hypothetical protein